MLAGTDILEEEEELPIAMIEKVKRKFWCLLNTECELYWIFIGKSTSNWKWKDNLGL